MNKKIITNQFHFIIKIILLVLITMSLNAQVTQQWVQSYNGTGNDDDYAGSIAVDGNGNVYVAGSSFGNGTYRDFLTIKYNSTGLQLWVQRYNGPGNSTDGVNSLVIDQSGNVYVTGSSWRGSNDQEYVTIKYNTNGVQQWIQKYNGPGYGTHIANALAVDGSGNVYVTGSSYGFGTITDFATIKYNSAGVQQWIKRYNGLGNSHDGATSIKIDGLGNVIVAGISYGITSGSDYAIVKYNSAGILLWVQRYDGTGDDEDYLRSLAIDRYGNVFVTGESWGIGSNWDYTTIKYNSSGYQKWIQRYNGPGNGWDVAHSIAPDTFGNVYITGRSWGGSTFDDYATIKYDTAGVQLWIQRYNGPDRGIDEASSLAVDDSGNVYVTGGSMGIGTEEDFATIKYNSTGVQQWVQRYSGSGNYIDVASSIAIDGFRNVYVVGSAKEIETDFDITTIKYQFKTFVQTPGIPQLLSPANFELIETLTPALVWNGVPNASKYDLQVSGNIGFTSLVINMTNLNVTQFNVPQGALVPSGKYYWRVRAKGITTGAWSDIWMFKVSSSAANFTGLNQIGTEIPKEYKLYNNFPNPFNPLTTIRFDLPEEGIVKLTVYDILGKEAALPVNESLSPGSYKINFDGTNLPSGVYFFRLTTGSFTDIKKMVLIK